MHATSGEQEEEEEEEEGGRGGGRGEGASPKGQFCWVAKRQLPTQVRLLQIPATPTCSSSRYSASVKARAALVSHTLLPLCCVQVSAVHLVVCSG